MASGLQTKNDVWAKFSASKAESFPGRNSWDSSRDVLVTGFVQVCVRELCHPIYLFWMCIFAHQPVLVGWSHRKKINTHYWSFVFQFSTFFLLHLTSHFFARRGLIQPSLALVDARAEFG